MQEFKIKTNSWHYKWLSWYRFTRDVYEPKSYYQSELVFEDKVKVADYHHEYYRRITNFCQYWRCVLLWPLLRFAFNLLPIIAAISAMIYFGFGGFVVGGSMLLFFAIVAAVLGACIYATAFIINKTSDAITAVEKTEFVGTIISTYKDNFCPLVTYESKNDE